jgi:hypothetical protein
MIVIDIRYKTTVLSVMPFTYTGVDVSISLAARSFSSDNFVYDWYCAMKYITQNKQFEFSSITYNHTVDSFLKQTKSNYILSFLHFTDNQPSLFYPSEIPDMSSISTFRGEKALIFFTETKMNWQELKSFVKQFEENNNAL